jgi:hypothetical protein
MKNQQGFNVVALSTLMGVGALVLVLVGSYITNYNYGNRTEKLIQATWTDNRNVLSQYSARIMEMAQVPDMYKNDIVEIYEGAMTGRYGEDGSQAMFQFLQEQNPQIDASLYTSIQQSMEAGRNKFENSQTKLIDQKRSYETKLGAFYSGIWLRIAGYPKIDLDAITIVMSDYANDAFESGVDNGLKLQ